MSCVVCGGLRREVFRAKVLDRYDAAFLSCDTCGLLQAAQPSWLDEAYLSPLASTDTGAVDRNLKIRNASSVVWERLFRSSGRFVDLAGGSGLFTRLMRDIGFDYWWSDRYMANIFASGFEARPGEVFDGATAIEVFEHLPNPREFLETTFAEFRPNALLFTTQLFEGAPPSKDWWYYSFATGQHISFYQRRTLEYLAQVVGMRLTSVAGLHLLTNRPFPERMLRLAGSRLCPVASRWACRRRKSLIEADHQRALGMGHLAP